MQDENKEKDTENEDIFVEEEGENAQETVKKIRKELKICLAEKQEYLTGWQRAKADFINLRREEDEKRLDCAKFAEKKMILDFLELADSFDRLAENKEFMKKLDKNWQSGLENLYEQMMKIFKNKGVEPIESIGTQFNPAEHEAIAEIEVDSEKQENIIIKEIKKGYRMNGAIIRPVHVKVGKFKH